MKSFKQTAFSVLIAGTLGVGGAAFATDTSRSRADEATSRTGEPPKSRSTEAPGQQKDKHKGDYSSDMKDKHHDKDKYSDDMKNKDDYAKDQPKDDHGVAGRSGGVGVDANVDADVDAGVLKK